MATVVVVITSMVAANATQSLTTPNAAFISCSLAGGANSAPITPATNKSVLVIGFQTRTPGRGPCETVGDAVDPPSQETEC
jgi:hypothetical protein